MHPYDSWSPARQSPWCAMECDVRVRRVQPCGCSVVTINKKHWPSFEFQLRAAHQPPPRRVTSSTTCKPCKGLSLDALSDFRRLLAIITVLMACTITHAICRPSSEVLYA